MNQYQIYEPIPIRFNPKLDYLTKCIVDTSSKDRIGIYLMLSFIP